MDELIGGLIAIREAATSGKEPEALLRRIRQLAEHCLRRAGISEAPAEVPAARDDERYLVDLGTVQMRGRLDENGVARGTIWVNDTAVEASGLEISIASGEPVKVHVIGVACHEGRAIAGSDHAGESAGGGGDA